jgi:2-hydroxy-6-oxonona-2,4-dienedioate hydrolase
MAAPGYETITIDGRPTRLLRKGKRGAPVVIFLHGGTPGLSPYCGGAHLWGAGLDLFAAERDIIALDLPGSGGSASPGAPTIDSMGEHVLSILASLGVARCHLVGHDLGAMVGLWIALERPGVLQSLSLVASRMTAPTGDSLDTLLLRDPPPPLWSRASQRWAFEQLSYSHLHIDDTLLDASVAASEGEPHRAAVASMRQDGSRLLAASVGRTKARLWEICRGAGLPVPTQLVWGSHDPATRRDEGMATYAAIAERQAATQFHLINRAGSFPFREQPQEFHHIVAAFQDGCSAEAARLKARA